MLTAAKYRLYPTKTQEELLIKHFGCVRLIYNLALEAKRCAWSSRGISLSRFDLSVQLKELKQTCDWLKEVNSQSLQAALLHLESAYRNFFGKTGRFPAFKSKHHKQSFHCPQYVQIEKGKLLIPKFREGIRLVLQLVDRDHNAAKNILEFALSKHSGMGRPTELVESPAVAGAVKQEKFRRAMPAS